MRSDSEREPGQLDMNAWDEIHNYLLRESAMYRYCIENKIPGLATHLQLKEVERRMAMVAALDYSA